MYIIDTFDEAIKHPNRIADGMLKSPSKSVDYIHLGTYYSYDNRNGHYSRNYYDGVDQSYFTKKSKSTYLEVMHRMQKEEKIEGVILGCTEIPLLIKQADTDLPVFDTTEIHVKPILDYAFN